MLYRSDLTDRDRARIPMVVCAFRLSARARCLHLMGTSTSPRWRESCSAIGGSTTCPSRRRASCATTPSLSSSSILRLPGTDSRCRRDVPATHSLFRCSVTLRPPRGDSPARRNFARTVGLGERIRHRRASWPRRDHQAALPSPAPDVLLGALADEPTGNL